MSDNCPRFFYRGKCKYGDDCKYAHNLRGSPNGGRPPDRGHVDSKHFKVESFTQEDQGTGSKNPKLQGGNPNICRYWKSGKCLYGVKCKFQHGADLQINANRTSVALTPRQLEKSKLIVKDDQTAEPSHGNEKKLKEDKRNEEAERMRRELEEKTARQEAIRKQQEAELEARGAKEEANRKQRQAAQEEIWKEDAAATTQHIVLGSTLITCAAGLEIRSVVSGFESCRLIVKGIPAAATQRDIADLFLQQGIDASEFIITQVVAARRALFPDKEAKGLEATVIIRREHAQVLAIGPDGIQFWDQILEFTLGNNHATNAMGESNAELSKVLTISWPDASARYVATYSTMDEAHRKVPELNNMVVGGRKLRVKINEILTGYRPAGYCASSIVINGLPVAIMPTDVMELAGTATVKPLKTNTYNRDEVMEALRGHLESIPESHWMRGIELVPERKTEDKTTVRVTFESWKHADRARASLDGKTLHAHFPKFWLDLPEPIQFVSTMPAEQYRAEKQIWDELVAKDGARIRIQVKGNQRTVVRVSGNDKKAVGLLKVKLETLIAGQSLGHTMWHRFFSSAGGRDFLRRVGVATGTFIRAETRARTLKIYGSQTSKDEAREQIKTKIERLSQLEYTVPLRRKAAGYLVRNGLLALQEMIGEDAVTLNLTTRPCTITIRGGEEARGALATVLDESMKNAEPAECADEGEQCPICYSNISSPVQLGCRHVYCFSCIRHYIVSAIETKNFPLACMGNEDTCKTPIAIPIIQRFLSPQQFDRLVQVAFSDYLDKHPNDFRYCPTPDCSQIYRCAKDVALKCPSCFVEVCANCHEEAHEGMTCDEMRIYRDPEEQERLNDEWAAGLGVKKCPSCRVWIEKTEGCNHMACRCGAHICWKCMQTFDAAAIYTHLQDAHGGAFDHTEPEDDFLPDVEYPLFFQDYVVPAPQPRFAFLQQNREAAEAQAERDRVAAEYLARAVREQEAREQERLERVRREQAMQQQMRRARELERAREEAAARFRLAREEEARRELRRATLLQAQAEQESEKQSGGWGCQIM